MGIFRDSNNRKRTEKEKHARRWKRQMKAAKKASKGPAPIVNIQDPELFSTEMMKNKLKNPRNNIQLSGRNRKKMLKRLKYDKLDEQRKAGAGEEKGDFVTDLFMEDVDKADETKSSAETAEMEDVGPSSKSSQPSSSGTATAKASSAKKKKRGGRKKKGKGAAESLGEDVEMEEL